MSPAYYSGHFGSEYLSARFHSRVLTRPMGTCMITRFVTVDPVDGQMALLCRSTIEIEDQFHEE
jgi:hypothetical protein